jgi:DNA polymerase III delta prime subunit
VEAQDRAFIETFRQFLEQCVHAVQVEDPDAGPPVAEVVQRHLGVDPRSLPVVSLTVPNHQYVNLDLAAEALIEDQPDAAVVGVGGGDQRHHFSFGDLLRMAAARQGGFSVGAVERDTLPTGPDSRRQVVAFGIHLFRFDGEPVVMLQRQAKPQYGRGDSGVEIVAREGLAEPLVAELRRLMVERSVFRGQVLSLGGGDDTYQPGIGGITFLRRPTLTRDDLVLPAGALERVERHVAGAARHRELLLAAGQHLKRGLLLYGPPGTGKTHTVRYLLAQMTGVTTVLLSGSSLGYVQAAAELAVGLQPALVVLEDVDLVAEARHFDHNPQPLLFTLLEAMDGLSGDADVAFLLTTNRADLLEPALAQRPGRVDLAVQIPLPDRESRRRLVRLYARGMPFSDAALDDVAARAEGTTASFAKELVRRATLLAAEAGHPVGDGDLTAGLDELMDDGEALTRSLLGSPAAQAAAAFGPPAVSPSAPRPAAYPGVHPGGWHPA